MKNGKIPYIWRPSASDCHVVISLQVRDRGAVAFSKLEMMFTTFQAHNRLNPCTAPTDYITISFYVHIDWVFSNSVRVGRHFELVVFQICVQLELVLVFSTEKKHFLALSADDSIAKCNKRWRIDYRTSAYSFVLTISTTIAWSLIYMLDRRLNPSS